MMNYRSNGCLEKLHHISHVQRVRTQSNASPWWVALFLMAVAVTLGQPMVASAAITELTSSAQGKGTKGFSWTPLDTDGNPANFTITARSHIAYWKPFEADAWGHSGTIYVDKDDKGIGVQNYLYGGSAGISGGGKDKDEELIFTFNAPTALDSVFLEINELEFGNGLNDKDDPVLFVSQAGSGVFNTITEVDILNNSAFTFTAGKRGTLNFGALYPLLGYTEIDTFKIRETRDHIYVTGLSGTSPVPVPAPGAFMLSCLGTAVVAFARNRRALARS
jgi:hypothetical protein